MSIETLEGQMGYISQNRETHKMAWELNVPWVVREWAAWYYISELMRRHPNVFTPVARFTMQKELMDMESGSEEGSLMIRVNRTGSITIWGNHKHPDRCPVEEGAEPNENMHIHLLDVYLAANPREIIKEIEACAGLIAPRETPLTGPATIGPRVIAELIRSRLHTDRAIVPVGVFQSSEYGDSIDKDMIREFSGLIDLANLEFRPEWHSITEHPVPLYSGLYGMFELLGPASNDGAKNLLFIIDIKTGVLHFEDSQLDLMRLYDANGRNIQATVAALLYK
jgi:hypothetical protein